MTLHLECGVGGRGGDHTAAARGLGVRWFRRSRNQEYVLFFFNYNWQPNLVFLIPTD